MSFTRPLYDECATKLKVNRSVGPGSYALYSGYGDNCNNCYPLYSITGSSGEGAKARKDCESGFGDIVDVESCLHNRNRILSECNGESCTGNNCDLSKFQKKIVFNDDCDSTRYSQDTRFTHPLDTYRGMSLTPYFMNPYLHVNPQCNPQSIDNGESSRLIAKDTFRLPKQNKWDTGEALPAPLPDREQNCSVCCPGKKQ